MKIAIRGSDIVLTAALRLRVERRLALALGRFGEQIAQVKLRLSRAEGETGKLCRIDVSLRPRRIRVEQSDPELSVALDRAADRASRSVARELLRDR